MRNNPRELARALADGIAAEERAADEAERLIVRVDRLGNPFRSEGVRAVVRHYRVQAIKLRARLAALHQEHGPFLDD